MCGRMAANGLPCTQMTTTGDCGRHTRQAPAATAPMRTSAAGRVAAADPFAGPAGGNERVDSAARAAFAAIPTSRLRSPQVAAAIDRVGPDGAGTLQDHGEGDPRITWGLDRPPYVNGWEPADVVDYDPTDPALVRVQTHLRDDVDVASCVATHDDPVLILRHRGEDILVDGNHRLARAAAAGETVPAVIVDSADFQVFADCGCQDPDDCGECDDGQTEHVVGLDRVIQRAGPADGTAARWVGEPDDPRRHTTEFFHGTTADLRPGTVIEPAGERSRQRAHWNMGHDDMAYATGNEGDGWRWAELAWNMPPRSLSTRWSVASASMP